MEKNLFTNEDTFENKPEEKMSIKAKQTEKLAFREYEVEKFDFEGFEIVRREWFSKLTYPAVTFRYGSVTFNSRAIKKLNECSHIVILVNKEQKIMCIKFCEEDGRDSLQWSKIDKRGKVVPRAITGQIFAAQLYKDMNWNIESTIKVLGVLQKCRGDKMFVFDLTNAEAYLRLAEPSADDPKRRTRVPFMPEHWQGNYGMLYEDSKQQMVMTFEDVPEGFVKITIPKKTKQDKDNSNEKTKEEAENGTI